MSHLSLCRICLAQNVRMFVINDTNLQTVYMQLSNNKMDEKENKIHMVCYICHRQLFKAHKLMQMAAKSNLLLKQLMLEENYKIEHKTNLLNLCISHVSDVNITCFKNNDYVEVKSEVNKSEIVEQNSGKEDFSDVDNTETKSDSEDDLPLKCISTTQTKSTEKVKVRKKKKEVISIDAIEIILSKEEQVKQLLDRAQSLNYLNSPYRCDLCYKGFIDSRAYDNHKEKHAKISGDFVCDICQMRYVTSRQLKNHVTTSHERQYACNKCEHRSHTANQAREHARWHAGHTYECPCGRSFRKPTSYLTHRRARHGTDHACGRCGAGFLSEHGLAVHRTKALCRNTDPESSEPEAERFCKECGIQFLSVDAWKRHMLTAVKHVQAHENSTQCNICNTRHPTRSALAQHLRTHANSLRRKTMPTPSAGKMAVKCCCNECGASFSSRSKLQQHINRIHLGLKYNKNIVCEICGKKCTSNASLKYHQRVHTGERPYGCAACGKRFSDANQLRIHTRTHTGERPYACAHCPKAFSQKPALNRHYRVHTGAKPYECQYCSKTFSQSNSMKLHVKTVHLKMPPNKKKGNADLPTEKNIN